MALRLLELQLRERQRLVPAAEMEQTFREVAVTPANGEPDAEVLSEAETVAHQLLGAHELARVEEERRRKIDICAARTPGLRLERERQAPFHVVDPPSVADMYARDATRIQRVREELVVAQVLGHLDRSVGELEALTNSPRESQEPRNLRDDEELLP